MQVEAQVPVELLAVGRIFGLHPDRRLGGVHPGGDEAHAGHRMFEPRKGGPGALEKHLLQPGRVFNRRNRQGQGVQIQVQGRAVVAGFLSVGDGFLHHAPGIQIAVDQGVADFIAQPVFPPAFGFRQDGEIQHRLGEGGTVVPAPAGGEEESGEPVLAGLGEISPVVQ